MPRGVPASGQRKPRAAAEPEAAFPSLAETTMDDAQRVDPPADLAQVAALDEPDSLITVEPVPVDALVDGPVEELTPEQEEIKRLRDQVAKLSGKKDIEPEFEELKRPGGDGNIVIHFLEDGLTALGQVWYRGQELEFEPGSKAYKDTFNRLGQSWLSLAGDDFAQVDKWGKVMFRPGPWPGKSYVDGSFEAMRSEKDESRVKPPSQEELERADKLRRSRRSAPVLPQQV